MINGRSPIRILLAEDYLVLREGLRLIISSQPHLQIVAEAATRKEALAAAGREQPDVILLDPLLGGENNLDILPELLRLSKQARVLLLTQVKNPEEHYRAVSLGATGVIFKEYDSEMLIKAIESVSSGKVWLEHTLIVSLLSKMLHDPEIEKINPELNKITNLTAREREVMSLVSMGLRNKQIADQLRIKVITVRHHLTSIFRKLGLNNRIELALFAYQYGLPKPPRHKLHRKPISS